MQAAVLRVKLKYLTEWNFRRQSISEIYLSAFRDNPYNFFPFPSTSNDYQSSWHLFVVRTKNRSFLQKYLSDRGVQTLIHYPIAPHCQRAFSDLNYTNSSLPLAYRLSNEVLSLPIGPHLSLDKVHHVINLLDHAK